jgi:hypothetical protein
MQDYAWNIIVSETLLLDDVAVQQKYSTNRIIRPTLLVMGTRSRTLRI